MGKVVAVCISERKGNSKKEVQQVELVENWGIKGDAHGGKWHRQISLLSIEKIEEFRDRGADVEFGAFGENIIVEGYDLRNLPVGTRFTIGEAEIEMTQIGKECHNHCAIFHKMGECIMPREGVFAKVVKGGNVKPGDTVVIHELDDSRPYSAAWITLSDKGFAGLRKDESGPLIEQLLTDEGYDVVEGILIPDERTDLKKELIRLADQRQVNVIFTTGGTGLSARDITPETTIEVCDRMVPGIAEGMRAYSMTKTSRAMLSRAVAGIRKRTLIINMPGSPKAVSECMEFLLPTLEHGIGVLRGTEGECAR